ncbi:MAG: DNRLRE domain-containing protein [Cytophagales bacterium]|nr:DNRLRE domain-containing protein [Cytophagales bacterium]
MKIKIRRIFLQPASMTLLLLVMTFISCDEETTSIGIDNEPAAGIGFMDTNGSVTEGSDPMILQVNASKKLFNDVSFGVKVIDGDGSAITISDADGNAGTNFTIKEGTKNVQLYVSVSDDDDYNGDYEVMYELENLSGEGAFLTVYTLGSGEKQINPSFNLEVREDDPVPPSIGFESEAGAVDENKGESHAITIALSEPASVAGSFELAYAGTAENGVNYQTDAPGGTVNIGIGAEEVVVNITPIDDDLVEDDKTVVLTISNISNGFLPGSITAYTLTIVEDDLPKVILNPEADCGIRGGDKGDDAAAGGEFARAANGTDSRGRDERQMMMRFDLAGVDLSKVIRATLKLTTVGTDAGGSDRFWTEAEDFNGSGAFDGTLAPTAQKIYHVTGDDNWDEVTVTWNTAPAFDPTPVTTGTFDLVESAVRSHEYDVTAALMSDSDGKFSIRLGTDNDTDGKSIYYQTRESTLGGVPELIIISNP